VAGAADRLAAPPAAGPDEEPAAVNRRHGFGPVVDGFLLSRH
jgi:hypothetical protein